MIQNDLKQIGKLLDEKLTLQKEEVIDEMIGFMEENLFPKFENMAEKSVPAVAHQLRLKKRK